MKKGFTLAEIMIVLMVIGILTAILLPSARNAMPNEDLMKFKKAHNMLHNAIRELVNSDEYYLDGDLGKKPNGDILVNSIHDNRTYFCSTFADVVNAKKVTCSDSLAGLGGVILTGGVGADASLLEFVPTKITPENVEENLIYLDNLCKQIAKDNGPEITLSDNIVIYQTRPASTFGMGTYRDSKGGAWYRSYGQGVFIDENGLEAAYKGICVDIDGIHPQATADDCVNLCPFSYAVRYDGKILNGARANEWLEKSIQDKD